MSGEGRGWEETRPPTEDRTASSPIALRAVLPNMAASGHAKLVNFPLSEIKREFHSCTRLVSSAQRPYGAGRQRTRQSGYGTALARRNILGAASLEPLLSEAENLQRDRRGSCRGRRGRPPSPHSMGSAVGRGKEFAGSG